MTIGRYRVLGLLGEGAMDSVYEGVDDELDRTVALKLVRSDALASDDAVARLVREARALARLAHPNVVGIHEVGREDGQVFLAMELVRGQTLREWRTAAHRSWSECLMVYVAAGQGLAAAHEAGLVHRDFKPANCILGDDGRQRFDHGPVDTQENLPAWRASSQGVRQYRQVNVAWPLSVSF